MRLGHGGGHAAVEENRRAGGHARVHGQGDRGRGEVLKETRG